MKTSDATATGITPPPSQPRKPQRRTQKERSAATRGSLMRAAVEVIGEFGWMSATTRLVAARAGVTRGALQHYFESRDDLLKAVAGEMFVQLHARLDTAALSAEPLDKRVDFLIQHYYDVYTSSLFRAVLSASLDPTSGASEHMRAGIERHQEMIDQTWRSLFRDLELPDVELRPLRRLVMSAIRGYAVQQSLWRRGTLWRTDAVLLRDMVVARLDRTRTIQA
ncbi:MAG: TetR family transcriptional regulator [Rhizobiales bacterium]|nr:TetR family transcriptional regulator [Hyphomicrobiales bacterium]